MEIIPFLSGNLEISIIPALSNTLPSTTPPLIERESPNLLAYLATTFGPLETSFEKKIAFGPFLAAAFVVVYTFSDVILGYV